MRKFYIGVLAGVSAFSLAACSDSATPVNGTTDKSDLTLEDVFNKAMDQQESIESVKATMVMDQTIAMTGEGEGEQLNLTSSTNMDMSMTTKPMAFYSEGEMSMTMADAEAFEMPLKMYFTEATGFYMYDMASEGWLKLPNESYEQILSQAGANTNATEQLEQLKPFLDDFVFEQNDSAYILTLNAKGEKFNDLIFGQLEGTLGQSLGEEIESLFENIQFENAKYIITIDKKTFDTTKIVTDLAMEMNMEGTNAKVNALSTINFSDFNKVDAITVPQDVIDNAVESEF